MTYNTTMVGLGKKSLFGKKKDPKEGTAWGDVSDDRKFRQHPHGISETDAHAIPKNNSPVLREAANPHETEAAIDEIQQRVNSLQEKPPEERIDESLIDDDVPNEDSKDKYNEDWTD